MWYITARLKKKRAAGQVSMEAYNLLYRIVKLFSAKRSFMHSLFCSVLCTSALDIDAYMLPTNIAIRALVPF